MRDRRIRHAAIAIGILLCGAGTVAGQRVVRERADSGSPVKATAFPIRFRLDRAGYVTVVIEDAAGLRVRNLIAEVRLPAGENTAWWDGYDEGTRNEAGDLVRRRAAPASYRAHGLVHDGLRLRYEFTAIGPGSPPWKTKDGSGGWLADHSPPADILYLPPGRGMAGGDPGRGQLLVCSSSGEAGDEFVWLTEDGRRLTGFNTGFWGGMFLARDLGPRAIPEHMAYTFISGERDPDNDTVEVRAFRRGLRGEQDVEPVIKVTFPHESKRFKTVAEGYGTNGLAVHDGLIVFSFTQFDKLVVADARARKVLGEIKMPAPRGLSFDRAGRLFVVTGGLVKRYTLARDGLRLESETVVSARPLDDPRRVSVDRAGNVYVSDWGRSHQVKVFSPDGTFVRAIGEPGGPQLGLYDERRMSHPCGVTIDGRGRLWVAEAEHLPKRLSVWKPDGGFERSYVGPPMYGGGGAIDPDDRSRFFYAEWFKNGGLELALDWQKGTSRPKAVYWRPERCPENVPGPAGQRAFRVGGRTYLTNCYNGDLRFNQDRGATIWRLDDDHIARPVVAIGNAADMNGPHGWSFRQKTEINALWKDKDPSRVLFVWSDRSGDQVAQADEIQWVAIERKDSQDDSLGGPGLQPMVHPDLSITTTHGIRIAAPRIDDRGTPIYDLEARSIVGQADVLRPPVVAGSWTLATLDGPGLVDALVGSDFEGRKRWRINAQREQVVAPRGQLAAVTRLLGPPVTPAAGEAGPLIAINGEMGSIFLVTMDGLVLQDLGGDARIKPYWRMPHARRGMPIEGISFEQEHFHPSISRLEDGSIDLVAGFDHSSILRIDGWESVRRREFSGIAVDEATLAALPETKVEANRKEARLALKLAMPARGPRVDGALDDWPASTEWASIGGRARAAVLVAEGRLFAAFRTGDPEVLNGGDGDYRYQFKRGGALDLMIGTDPDADRRRQEPAAGDLRLLVTLVGGKPRAVLYRAVAPGAREGESVTYQSPIGKVLFQQVRDVTSAIRLAGQGGDFELSVLLETLGLMPRKGMEVLGDLGLLRGDGRQTVERLYWNNLDTQLVSDLPGEARLRPGQWGRWSFP